MKKITLLFLIDILTVCAFEAKAQFETIVEVTDQANEQLRQKMSKNASDLLTEINRAFSAKQTPDLSRTGITNEARQNVLQIWDHSMFRCKADDLMPRCLAVTGGFQIREIPIFIQEDKVNQDAVINFNSAGEISAFYFSVEAHKYMDIIREGKTVTDIRRRQMILDFVENFRTAYNRKDADLIETMYSDDVLIITGIVYKITGDQMKGIPQEHVRYVKQSKEEYMRKLRNIFRVNKFVNIGFDSISVVQHPVKTDIYGVTLIQRWRTSNYNDDGWLFLAVQFQTETEMLIHVRTWQPYMLNGKIVTPFQMGEFDF